MSQKQQDQASNQSKIYRGYFFYGVFLLILVYQAMNPQMDFLGPRFIGAFFEAFLVSMFMLALGGIVGLIYAIPLCGIYYLLLVQTVLLIVRSRWWISVLLLLPIVALIGSREFNIEYQTAYYNTFRGMTSNESCKNTDAFHAYICRMVIERNIYQKTHVEYCRTLRMGYSACIQNIVFFTKNISTCSLLNQDIALKYTGSSTAPYVRDCVKNFVNQEHLSLEQACTIFTVPGDYDDCVDVFVDQTKNWSLCDRMKEQRAVERCKYYRNEYLKAQKK
jgi:hypothetical protein